MAPVELRSKERVSENGEVFTPFDIVDKMNALVPEEVWKDKAYIFLEPTCGNGQFIVRILEKRIENGLSLEEACNTLFGMDIMPDNIEQCHKRVLEICYEKMIVGNELKNIRGSLYKLMDIVLNNIILVEDSLAFIKEGRVQEWKYYSKNPSGKRDECLSSSERKESSEKFSAKKKGYMKHIEALHKSNKVAPVETVVKKTAPVKKQVVKKPADELDLDGILALQ